VCFFKTSDVLERSNNKQLMANITTSAAFYTAKQCFCLSSAASRSPRTDEKKQDEEIA